MEVEVFDESKYSLLSEEQFKSYFNLYRFSKYTNNFAGQHLAFKDIGFSIQLYSYYIFCCGLREIGAVYIKSDTNVRALREKFISLVESNALLGNVGALTYTRTRDRNEKNLQSEEVIEFIEKWPGASKGDWFFNPNSGNMVQQWTLPINQSKSHAYDDDCEEDYGE